MSGAFIATIAILTSQAAAQPEVLQPPSIPETPQIFAKDLVSLPGRYEFCSTMSADRTTVYIGIEHGKWQSIEAHDWDGAQWTARRHIKGTEQANAHDPYLSRDGKRLYFITRQTGNAEIAYLPQDTTKETGWGDTVPLSAPVNTPADEYYTSITEAGDIVFASDREGSLGSYDIYRAAPASDGYADPKPFPNGINTRYYEADPFIDPAGRYLLFASSRPGGKGRGDIYISFAEGKDGWSEPVALSDNVNTSGHELCPMITADGKIFMFTSNEDIYWTSADMIETLVAKHKASPEDTASE